MNIHYTSDFIKSFKRLPKEIQTMATRQEAIFKQNPQDPRLHSKSLKGDLKGLSSFRITRNYRLLYVWKDKRNVVFYEIGDRKWIYG